jgi:hypothetical protein
LDAELMGLGRSLRSLCYPRVVAPKPQTKAHSTFSVKNAGRNGAGDIHLRPNPRTAAEQRRISA